jgi:glycerol-3-phosphate dehydrogenase
VFAGLRPLVSGNETDTAALSREHTILVAHSGLLTIAGGKWTTYRKMAEDTVDHAATLAGLEPRECITRRLNIHGFHPHARRFGALADYGSDAPAIERLMTAEPALGVRVHPALPILAGQVAWAVREEAARTVDDVLARRTRALLFDARAAAEAAPATAHIMARELGRDAAWERLQTDAFREISARYLPG